MWSSGPGWQPRAAETWLQGYGRRQNLRPRSLIYLHSLYSWNLCCIALYCLHCTNECVQENVFNSLKQKAASLRLFVLEGDGRRSSSWERIFLCPFLSRQFQVPDRCCKVAVFRGAPVFTQRSGTAAPSKGGQGERGLFPGLFGWKPSIAGACQHISQGYRAGFVLPPSPDIYSIVSASFC